MEEVQPAAPEREKKARPIVIYLLVAAGLYALVHAYPPNPYPSPRNRQLPQGGGIFFYDFLGQWVFLAAF